MAYFEMSRLALKWALTKPPTSRYPFEPRRALAGSRGRLVFTRDNCVYCTVCAKKCPTGALTVNRAQKKWAIDRLLCITCGYCVEACPKKSLELGTDHATPTVTPPRRADGDQRLGVLLRKSLRRMSSRRLEGFVVGRVPTRGGPSVGPYDFATAPTIVR